MHSVGEYLFHRLRNAFLAAASPHGTKRCSGGTQPLPAPLPRGRAHSATRRTRALPLPRLPDKRTHSEEGSRAPGLARAPRFSPGPAPAGTARASARRHLNSWRPPPAARRGSAREWQLGKEKPPLQTPRRPRSAAVRPQNAAEAPALAPLRPRSLRALPQYGGRASQLPRAS